MSDSLIAPLEKEAPFWRFLTNSAALLSIPGLLLTLTPVQERIFNRSPRLQIEIVSQLPVFEAKTPLDGLTVTLRNDNLLSPPRKITAVRIRLVNSGGTAIKPDMISPQDPIGIRISEGQLLRISKVQATSKHLRLVSKPIIFGRDIVFNTGLIIEPQDYVNLDVLVIQKSDRFAKFEAIGKVVGQTSIDVKDIVRNPPVKGILQQSLSGSYSVQAIRIVFYFFITFGLLSMIMWLSDRINQLRIRQGASLGKKISSDPIFIDSSIHETIKEVALGVLQYLGTKKAIQYADRRRKIRHIYSLPTKHLDPIRTLSKKISPSAPDVYHYLIDNDNDLRPVDYILVRFGLMSETECSEEIILALDTITGIAEANGYLGYRGVSDLSLNFQYLHKSY